MGTNVSQDIRRGVGVQNVKEKIYCFKSNVYDKVFAQKKILYFCKNFVKRFMDNGHDYGKIKWTEH